MRIPTLGKTFKERAAFLTAFTVAPVIIGVIRALIGGVMSWLNNQR